MDESQELGERFTQLTRDLGEDNIQVFRNSFLEMRICEQGQFYQSLTEENRQPIYSHLSPRELADMFDVAEEDSEYMKEYLDGMCPSYAADMLSEMYTDSAIDLLNILDRKQVAKYLSLMSADDASEVKELLHYENKVADMIMTTEFVSIVTDQTVRSAMYVLENEADVAETTYYIYVVNQEGQLVGVISLRNLIASDDDAMISDPMSERVFSVRVGNDQEDATRTFRDYDFLALPVTDYDDYLLGIVTIDDIIDVIDDGAANDYSRLARVNVGEINGSPVKAASRRLSWLVTPLFLGMSTASLISHHEDLVSEVDILTVFISLIARTASNAGAQSLVVAARRLAISDEKDHGFVRLVLAEVLTGVVTGAVMGITVFLIVGFREHNLVLGSVIGMAMLFAITVANLAGSLILMLVDRLGSDPAVASGPFITTSSDLASISIYSDIVPLFMSYFM